MKRIIYTFCVAIGTLLAISCSKSENSVEKQVKTSGFNIPAEAKAIIPEEFIGKMAANGMTIISGNGNKFTAYLDMDITDIEIKTRDVSVLSGEITPEGIKNFQYAFLKMEKTGDFSERMVPVGTIRIWISKDKLAIKKQEYPYGD